MVEYFKMDHESVGFGNSKMDCADVKLGHKHDPHTHDRFGNGDSACPGHPAQPLFTLPR